MNVCQLGHTHHDSIEVSTVQGRFRVFDTAKYMDHPGFYCTGQDVCSQTIAGLGHWELHDSKAIGEILAAGDRSRLVIDFGSHCGWYSIMAAKAGYDVLAIDGDAENLGLLQRNAELHRVEDKIRTRHAWVDDKFRLRTKRDVELVKIDLESYDRFAVSACWPFIDRVHNLYVEISPAFRPDYPDLVNRLVEAGFRAYWPDDRDFVDDYTLGQFNLRFSR